MWNKALFRSSIMGTLLSVLACHGMMSVAHASYLAASWVSDTDQRLYILRSDDAHTFTGDYAVYDPPDDDVVRDPSIMYDDATGYWWVAYTAGHWSVAADYIGLARSPDTIHWESVTRIDTSSVAQGNPRSWAPEWVEDDDGWHVIAGLSSNGGSGLEMYELHPTNSEFTAWSQPEKLTGLQNNVVDGMVTLIDEVYHLWYTDRTTGPWANVHATAESLVGPYTLDPSLQGHWLTGPGDSASEGPYVVNIEDDHWRMFFDQPGAGTKLVPGQGTGIYIDSFDGMLTWGPASQIISPAKRHLSILNLDQVGPPLVGDLNDDGFVGITDLNIVLGAWNQNVPPADGAADPSGDGFVGIEDLNVVLGNWNAGTPPTSPVPEPAGTAMLLIGSLALLRRAG